jgi:tetratricopeptide (TPR) repeat protein
LRRAGKPLVVVYTIARNEEHHVERWATSVREADGVFLFDTGSTDGTVERARGLGVVVREIRVEPVRYDAARNLALDLLPHDADVCVSLDLDEVLLPGWRKQLGAAWRGGATRVRCWYEWPWSEVHPALRFTTADRVHARHGYRWRYPVHEEPVSLGAEVVVESGVEIRHLRDSTGSRPHYLPLLRLRAAENPNDGRTAHLLASEARLRGLREEARFHERRALELPLAPNERLHATLMLSHLEPEARQDWIVAACAEFGGRREPWCELAQLHLERGDWRACRAAALRALRIEHPADDYLTNVFAWGAWPEKLAALASVELRDHERAAHHARRALQVLPEDEELTRLLRRATEALRT